MPRLKTPVLLSYSGWSPGVFFRFQNLWSFHLKNIINRTSRFSSPMIPGKWEMDKTWVKPLVTNQCQIWNDVNWWSWKSTWNLGETIAAIGRSKALKMDSDVLWCLIHPGLNISECLPLLKGSQKSWVIIFLSIDPQNHAMHVAKDPEISTKEVSLGSASPWPSNCLVSAHAEETPRWKLRMKITQNNLESTYIIQIGNSQMERTTLL